MSNIFNSQIRSIILKNGVSEVKTDFCQGNEKIVNKNRKTMDFVELFIN